MCAHANREPVHSNFAPMQPRQMQPIPYGGGYGGGGGGGGGGYGGSGGGGGYGGGGYGGGPSHGGGSYGGGPGYGQPAQQQQQPMPQQQAAVPAGYPSQEQCKELATMVAAVLILWHCLDMQYKDWYNAQGYYGYPGIEQGAQPSASAAAAAASRK